MPTFRRFSVLLSLAVASLLFTVALPVAHGQTLASTASFSGSVSDSTGARLPNAKVTLNNPEKGITRTFTTDPEGNFSFALLPAGTYTLTVEAAGFKTSKQTGITLEVGQSANQSIALTIGSVEQIEVIVDASLFCRWTTPTSAPKFLKTSDRIAAQSAKRVQLCGVELFGEQPFAAGRPFRRGGAAGHSRSGRLLLQLWRRLTLEPPHSCWMAPGTQARAGAASSTFPRPTTCRNSRCSRTHLRRNMAGALET